MKLNALEFYSGIGGLHYGLQEAAPGASVSAAFDLNETANRTYEHNFGARPQQVNIGKLQGKKLDKYQASMWMLSPPCQPYTRKGLKKDSQDGRATSFLEVLEDILPVMQHKPSYLLVENVVGFETSQTRTKLVAKLQACGYSVQEFLLSPLDFGIPYSRPRYFCLAKLSPLGFAAKPREDGQPFQCPPSSLLMSAECGPRDDTDAAQASSGRDVSEFLVSDPLGEWNGAQPQLQHEEGGAHSATVGVSVTSEDPWELYRVPKAVIEQNSLVLDAVGPTAKRIKCFTKTYSRYAKATGSVLATRNLDCLLGHQTQNHSHSHQLDRQEGCKLRKLDHDGEGCGAVSPSEAGADGGSEEAATEHCRQMGELGLRYFTPREVANFHSFPAEFSFPGEVTLRQRYALLGNSLSVKVVAELIKYLLREPQEYVCIA